MYSAVYAVLQCPSTCLSLCHTALVYRVETTELIIKQLALDCSYSSYGHQTWRR